MKISVDIPWKDQILQYKREGYYKFDCPFSQALHDSNSKEENSSIHILN